MRFLASTVAAAVVVISAAASAQSLSIGDNAPSLANTTWVQGDPVSHWQPGQVYVLDFWAPWCGPCIASMPHVNELHRTYKDKGVTIIGVSIWPNENMTPTDEFVDEHVVNPETGEKILYNIAEDVNGATARAFMEATGSQGIPTVMIIDQEGRLAWLGHPMDKDFDKSLKEVVEGRYDIQTKVREVRERKELEAKAQPLIAAARAAQSNGDWETLVARFDDLINMGFDAEQMMLAKIQVLALRLERPADAWKTGWEFLRGVGANSPQRLNTLAWFIVDNQALKHRDLKLAHAAATRANELSGGTDAGILDTLAHVEFAQGNRAAAVETQKRAIEHASPREREEFQKSLERFEKGGSVAP